MTRFLALATIGFALAACNGDDVTAPDGDWDGIDHFESNSLSQYDALTIRGGPTDIWSINDSWLIARAQGDVFRGLLLREDVEMRDGRIQIESDQLAFSGIVFRYQGPTDYYVLDIRDDGNPYSSARARNFELYYGETTLARIDLDLPRGEAVTVTVEFVGEVITLYRDGRLVQEIRDQSLLTTGSVGLMHGDLLAPGDESRWDVFRWKSLD